MTPRQAVTSGIAKAFQFGGRSSRPEYWWFLAGLVLVSIGVSGLAYLITSDAAVRLAMRNIVSLAIFIPLISCGFRRLHDIGLAGGVMLIPVASSAVTKVALEGGILEHRWFSPPDLGPALTALLLALQTALVLTVLWWLACPSQPGPNRYGPPPCRVSP